jgi:hypothetical protein
VDSRRDNDDRERTVDDLPGVILENALFLGNAFDKFAGIRSSPMRGWTEPCADVLVSPAQMAGNPGF